MKRRTVLWWSGFLLAVVLFLGVRQWRLSRQGNPVSSPTPTPMPYLFPLSFVERVQRLEIYRGDERVLAVQRDGETWRPVSEEDTLSPEMARTLTFLLSTRVMSVVPSDVSLDTVGLTEPVWRMRVAASDTYYNLDIGATTPVGQGYYVRRVPRGEVFVVPAALVEGLLQGLLPEPQEGTPTPFSAPTPTPGG